jgi:phosphatidate cytidylyltransferase
MFRQRFLVALILLPIGIYLTVLGGLPFFLMMLTFLGLAAWEFIQLFRAGGFRASAVVAVIGVAALAIGRFANGDNPFAYDSALLSAIVIAAMVLHLVDYERGAPFSGTDFSITVAGVVYFGFLGSYMILLRSLPDGLWWFLSVLPTVWFADSGAYFVGKGMGETQFSPRLSPKKTWEGYFGGVLFGLGGGALMPWLLGQIAGVPIAPKPAFGAMLGLTLSVILPLADLGQSMIKRQVGIKDSSNLLPGHGGIFDRIDTWIWAGVIGYYLINWFV